MLQLRIQHGRRRLPVYDLPTVLGRRGAYQELGDQIDALLAFMDDLQGDVDLEDSEAGLSNIDERGHLLPGSYVPLGQDEDREPDDDAKGDQSWLEWHTRGRRKVDSAGAEPLGRNRYGERLTEDDEDCDPAEEDDDSGEHAGEDDPNGWRSHGRVAAGAGCPISDPGGGNVLDEAHDPEECLKLAYGIDQSLGPVNLATAYQRHQLGEQLADLRRHGQHTLAKGVAARIARISEREAATIARANVGNDN
jgi:hypothetical protein